MQRESTYLVCDVCDRDSTETVVEQRLLKVNAKEVESEVCEDCWPAESLTAILKAGRRPGTKPRLIRV